MRSIPSILVSSIFALFPHTSHAADIVPQTLDLAERPEVLADISPRAKAVRILSPNRVFVVEGDVVFGSQLLAAEELRFKPKGRLILNDSTPNTASSFFIIVDRIVAEDPNAPGTITWSKSVPPPASNTGQAASGRTGVGEGASGGAGATGAPGASGTAGIRAPELTLIARTAPTGGVVIDFSGGDGGAGGAGQTGGDGGSGARGTPARQARNNVLGTTVWLPSCDAGPGWGGAGGNGGIGGPGGIGGVGGNGGNVTLASTPENVPMMFKAFRVNMAGGAGGKGGAPGGGGKAGPGGPEGQLANFCNSANRGGPAGAPGGMGVAGLNGEQGRAGQPFVSQIQPQALTELFAMKP